MYTPANVCTVCWQGSYINGTCSHCRHQQTKSEDRRPDALALMDTINGRYVVGEVLGKGGYGITYSAWDNAENRRVALKELFPNKSVYRGSNRRSVEVMAGHAEYFSAVKRKFEEEANLLRLLADDCSVVRVYDLFHSNNTVYYAMEFLEGCDLNAYRKQHGLLSWNFLVPIVKELLTTLKILHNQNLIHRDISPDNIFLTKHNQVRLIDFGSARTYQGKSNFTVLVKAGFAPWEQTVSDGMQGPWTDIYALSVTIYLLLSGKLPPRAEDRMAGKQVEPLAKLCPELPGNVVKAIEKGMSVKRQDRFQDAQSYMQALFGQPSVTTGPGTVQPGTYGPVSTPPAVTPIPRGEHVYWLYGINGVYAGRRKRLTPNREVTFGRRSTNEITFPDNTVGVSRNQCVLLVNSAGELLARDAGSSYGTFLNNKRLGPEWVKVMPGSRLRFGNEQFQLNCQLLPK